MFHRIKNCNFGVESFLYEGSLKLTGNGKHRLERYNRFDYTHTLNTRHGTNVHCAKFAGHGWCFSACIYVCVCSCDLYGRQWEPLPSEGMVGNTGICLQALSIGLSLFLTQFSRFLSPSLTPFLHLHLRSMSLWLSVLFVLVMTCSPQTHLYTPPLQLIDRQTDNDR